VIGRFTILGLILAAQTLANIGPLGIPAIAKLIREDLGLTLTQAGSFLSAYYIGPILMSMPAGTMADHWGIKRTLVLGQIVIAAGLLAVSAAGSYPTLIVLMIVAGFGYGMLNPTSTKAVMAWFPPAQRATVIGLKQVGLPFGGALGAALMPALALAVGWRLAVVTSALVILSTAVASLLIYRDPAGLPPPTTGARTAFRAVLLTRDLWLVAIATLMFAGVQTVFMAFLVSTSPTSRRFRSSRPGATWHSRRSPGWPGASSSACSRIARSADAVACRWRWRGSGRRSVRWPSP